MRRHWAELRWPLLAGLTPVLPMLGVLLSGHTLVWRDTAQLNAPLRPLIGEALRAFRVPGWNPFEGTGQPLFGQLLNGVLHPASLALAPFTDSMDAMIVLLCALAGAGAWVAARVLGASRVGALGAAFAFALSGFVLSMADNTSYLMPTATGPWAVAALAVAADGRRTWAWAALAVAALALAGDPGSVAAFALTGAALAVHTRGWRALGVVAAACALGVGIAAVQLWPSWVYMADTARGRGQLYPGDLHRWALAPWRVLELVAPGFLVGLPRSYDAPVFAVLDGATPDRFPFVPSVFVGGVTVLLAGVGAARVAWARWLAGLALLFLWFALGHRAGSQQLLSWVPLWGVLRFWEKMVGPLTLCLALGAAAGLDVLSSGGAPLVRRVALGALAAVIILLTLSATPAGPALFPGRPAVAALAATRLEIGLLHAVLALASLAALAWLAPGRPRQAAWAAVALLWLEAAAASPFALHPGDRAALALRPPELAAPPPGPRLAAPLPCDSPTGLGELDAIDLMNACERRSGRPSANAAARVDTFPTYSSLTSSRWDMVEASLAYYWPIARRLGTTHVLARAPATALEAQVLSAAVVNARGPAQLDGGALLVWELPHRPWASFAAAARPVPDLRTAAGELARVLEAGSIEVVVETAGSLGPLAPGGVLGVDRRADEVTIAAESTGDALLVVNDAWSSGWRAWIDGRETPLLPADVLARAVRWPAGRHELRMRYEPPGLVAGTAITLASLLLLALAVLLRRRPPGAHGRTS